jgi:hypothetical protein
LFGALYYLTVLNDAIHDGLEFRRFVHIEEAEPSRINQAEEKLMQIFFKNNPSLSSLIPFNKRIGKDKEKGELKQNRTRRKTRN